MAGAIVAAKSCKTCRVVRPLSDFVADKRNKSGKGARCKPCHAAASAIWAGANRQRMKQLQAAWYLRNKEKAKRDGAAWRAAHLERKKATTQAWQKTNAERFARKQTAWAKANPDKVKAKRIPITRGIRG